MVKRKKPEDAVLLPNNGTRDKVCASSAGYMRSTAQSLHERTGASVATVVVSENEVQYQYSSAPMHQVLAQHGYQPIEPMANFRAVSDPNVQDLNPEQLALLVQRTDAARAAIEAERNRRLGNN